MDWATEQGEPWFAERRRFAIVIADGDPGAGGIERLAKSAGATLSDWLPLRQ